MAKSDNTLARAKRKRPGLRGLKAETIKRIKKPVRKPLVFYSAEQTAKMQAVFLTTLAKTGNVGASAKAAGVSRSLVYKTWRCEGTLREWTKDELAKAEAFKELWDEAIENACDLLEKEAWRRGVQGYDKPIVFKGKITTTYKEYSDRMLELLLKAHRKKFRDRTEVSGEGGGPVPVMVTKVERVIVDPKPRDEE